MRESITYIQEGTKIFGVLDYDEKKCSPGVLICHGFNGNKVGAQRLFVHCANTLLQKGYAVFRFDFRGHGDSEGEIDHFSIQDWVSDAQLALKFMKDHPCIDKDKISVIGVSLGASIALQSFTCMSLSSLVLWAPVFSTSIWLQDWEERNGSISSLNAIYYQGVKISSKMMREFVTFKGEKYVEKYHSTPLLHVYAEKDEQISRRQKEKLTACRILQNAITDSIVIPDCTHVFIHPIGRKTLIDSTCQWIEKWNKI